MKKFLVSLALLHALTIHATTEKQKDPNKMGKGARRLFVITVKTPKGIDAKQIDEITIKLGKKNSNKPIYINVDLKNKPIGHGALAASETSCKLKNGKWSKEQDQKEQTIIGDLSVSIAGSQATGETLKNALLGLKDENSKKAFSNTLSFSYTPASTTDAKK